MEQKKKLAVFFGTLGAVLLALIVLLAVLLGQSCSQRLPSDPDGSGSSAGSSDRFWPLGAADRRRQRSGRDVRHTGERHDEGRRRNADDGPAKRRYVRSGKDHRVLRHGRDDERSTQSGYDDRYRQI